MLTSTVYIVEDDADAREVFVKLLQSSGFRAQPFASAEELLRARVWDEERPACVVVDVHLPGMSGLELQKALREDARRLPVIIMTGRGDVATARAALLSGAFDFLEKPVELKRLLPAVQTALASDLEAFELARKRSQGAELIKRLTPRECEVFQHLADGLTTREIAVKLGISPRTVESYRARVMDTLKARGVIDLFRLRMMTHDD